MEEGEFRISTDARCAAVS